jgi:hypothetical protein
MDTSYYNGKAITACRDLGLLLGHDADGPEGAPPHHPDP